MRARTLTRSKAYVSINAHTIRKNAVVGSNEPPIRVARTKSDRAPRYAHEIKITGPSRLVYSPSCPLLKCGARLVLEADAEHIKVIR